MSGWEATPLWLGYLAVVGVAAWAVCRRAADRGEGEGKTRRTK